MSRIVGIDLGTTNSLVAMVDAGIPLVIADAEGRRLTPSVVHFPGGDGVPIVGHKANRVRVVKPAETVYSIKRFMGRRGSEIPREEMLVTYPVKGEGAGPITVASSRGGARRTAGPGGGGGLVGTARWRSTSSAISSRVGETSDSKPWIWSPR